MFQNITIYHKENNKYTRYNSEITNYYIALGYYLGMKAMREIEKLK